MKAGMRAVRGMTLIEMLTVVTIIAILAAVAVPSFASLAASQRVKTTATKLQSALLLTRSEGLKRNANVQLAPATGTVWNTGWNVKEVSSGTVLGTFPGSPAVIITGPAAVTYQSTGRIGAASSASFKVSSSSSSNVRCVTVTVSGVPTIALSGC